MTVENLIKAGKDQVRRNPDLMSAYIQLFTEKFGRKPDCAGCTFARDWTQLTNSTNIQNFEIMSDKTFRLKNNGIIYSYDIDDKKTKRKLRKRAYGNIMSEEFAEAYLTHGTPQEIADRKKQFAVLPAQFADADDSVNLSKLTVPKLQEFAKDNGYPEDEWKYLKKDDLVAYLNAKEIDADADEDGGDTQNDEGEDSEGAE